MPSIVVLVAIPAGTGSSEGRDPEPLTGSEQHGPGPAVQ